MDGYEIITTGREEKYHIQVCVRCKPLSNRERNAVKVTNYNGSSAKDIHIGEKQFMFDNIFDALASQEYVYQSCIKPLVDGFFHGYNGTVFACKYYVIMFQCSHRFFSST
jgi:hypothetical protein